VPDVDAGVQKQKPDYSLYAKLQQAKSTDEYWQTINELIANGQGYLSNFKKGQMVATRCGTSGSGRRT
jgi:hypothetical protein